MAEAVNVKWPGQQIADDSTHRLVTDAQIERWNKSDYTDLVVSDDLNIDSLQNGKYKIKFGLDSYIFNITASEAWHIYKDYPEKFKMFEHYALKPNYDNIITNLLQMSEIVNKISAYQYNEEYHGQLSCYSGAIIQNIFINVINDCREITMQVIVYNGIKFIDDESKDLFICSLDGDGGQIYEYNFIQYKMYPLTNPYGESDNIINGNYEKIWSAPKLMCDPTLKSLSTHLNIYIGDMEYNYHPNMYNGGSYTIDLNNSMLHKKVSNWNNAITAGIYYSTAGATNAPTSDIAYMGSVVRGATSITQKLYADTDDLTAVSEYIRRGKITKDADNNETITWGNWYCIDYSVPTTASSQE